MDSPKKIRVLIVDDSLLFREKVRELMSKDPGMEIVAVAANPFEARDKILETRPDVITCDVEMPLMNGIEFVRQLLPQYFVPVVMVSSVSGKVFEALEAGAIDFVAKPDTGSPRDVGAFIQALTQKIRVAATVKAARPGRERPRPRVPVSLPQDAGRIIAIGASTGGTEAISSILCALPPTVPGIVVVQHIPPVFSAMFAQRLDSETPLRVREARTGDFVERGSVLVAPGDRHLRIKKIGGRYQAECFEAPKVSGHCPSVDVLFESVAREAGGGAIGILLTGMGHDGAKGLLDIRRKGGRTIGQDEASCVVYGMPKAAFDIGAVETQAALGSIPQLLVNRLS
ncbi:MAG: chemotaxis response regulator protein-glutamate methylesterase [Clostridiales bacterium]|nr:chemotaxis response regulator protein-glutamate methylesterase [Clostridiales bacterium]